MRSGEYPLGMIATPLQGNSVVPETVWCADNSCFSICIKHSKFDSSCPKCLGKYPGDLTYLSWLSKNRPHRRYCHFATAPDVVGDAVATLERSSPMFSAIRSLGYRVALVAQDGLENLDVPWLSFDALFIGGSTEWKLSREAASLVHQATLNGIEFRHMGRVNSYLRFTYAKSIGCTSVDGTFLAFGPDVNLPKLLSWLDN